MLALYAVTFLPAAPTPESGLHRPKVIIDPGFQHPDHQTTPEQLDKRADALRSGNCGPNAKNHGFRRFDSPISVGESLGTTVRTIRVVEFAPMGDGRMFNQLKSRLLEVWTEKFQSSYCYMAWAEGESWYVEAELEFEDGKRGVLITDGSHVALRDHDGNSWYFRLLPAAQ